MKKIFILTLMMAAVLYACKSSKKSAGASASATSQVPPEEAEEEECSGETLLYGKDISPLMTKYCTKCHQGGRAPAGVDLTTFAGVKRIADNDKLACVLRGENCRAMPPMGKIADDDMLKIICWMRNGAPE